jgi:hypothetical protein
MAHDNRSLSGRRSCLAGAHMCDRHLSSLPMSDSSCRLWRGPFEWRPTRRNTVSPFRRAILRMPSWPPQQRRRTSPDTRRYSAAYDWSGLQGARPGCRSAAGKQRGATMRVLKLVSPCHRSWEELQGSGPIRYCEACATSVHDLDALSPEELADLSRSRPGGFCGRSTRRAASGVAAVLLLGVATACTSQGERRAEPLGRIATAPQPTTQPSPAPSPAALPSAQPRMTRELCESLSALGGYMSVDCSDLPSGSERR